MENHSFNEGHSLSGNLGLLGPTKTKPLSSQPIRVKALMALCNSDDEDSEDKGKDSESESDSEDIQPLPDDDQGEEEEEAQRLSSLTEEPAVPFGRTLNENKVDAPCVPEIYLTSVKETDAISNSEKLEQKRRFAHEHESFRASETVCNSEVTRKADNYNYDEQLHRKIHTSKTASVSSSESVSTISQVSVISNQVGGNRRSNVKFDKPELYVGAENPRYGAGVVKLDGRTHSFEAQEPHEKVSYNSSLPVKSESIIYASKVHSSRPSSSKFEAPKATYSTHERHLHSSSVAQSESLSNAASVLQAPTSGHSIADARMHAARPSSSKFEEVNYYANERNLHSSNVAQPELASSAASGLQAPTSGLQAPTSGLQAPTSGLQAPTSGLQAPTSGLQAPTSAHTIIDTPLKHNPPLGSSRPTPSLAHRSMFQTPQGSKHRQDYSKSHVQTPATIFGNWSQNHMIQTPLQSRSTPSDVARSQGPSIIAQHGHDAPWHRNTEDKDRPRRKPLGEAIQTSQHSSDKPSGPYPLESSSFSKTQESGDNNKDRGLPESAKDVSAKKPAALGAHESKANRCPQPIEKSIANQEPPRSRSSESVKESINGGANGSVNETRSEPRPKVGSIQTSESQAAPQSFRSSHSSRPNPTAAAAEKKNVSERKANVQSSIPSSIPRSNLGETITVKDKEYLILGKLGEGMSGQVLRVQDLKSRELRAIKVVNLNHMDKDTAHGCLQEISMLHKLQAPCVVRMFDYEIEFPMVHVILEMGDTDFRSLLHSMSERKKLPLTMILYYWTEMLTAVKHIHDHGVIHSDLKPANFLLVRGRLKLIDFGIASSMNPDSTSVVKNNQIGTINYISPEALMDIGNGGGDSPNKVKYKITFKSDVWSLGCILYSLVYGHTPFQHIRAGWAKMHAITNPNPNISYALPTGSDAEPPPPVLIDVMRNCLQHDPKARPTVAQLLQIPYVSNKQNTVEPSAVIPANMLLKIRPVLTESEWRQFIQIMEAKRNQW